jgi:hypothetical protein
MSKFELYLTELTDFKRREIAKELEDEGENSWGVWDNKKKKIIKKFEKRAERGAQAYADACNKKSDSKNFSVIEVA